MQKLVPSFMPCAVRVALALSLGVTAAAQAGHPFVTDDTGTQGKGGWQFEATADFTRVKEDGVKTRGHEYGLGLSYGVIDTVDIGIAVPYSRIKTDGESAIRGVGDTTVQAKWRFYENDAGWSVAVKPALTFPTGSESKGLGTGRTTASVGLLGQYEKNGWTWMINGGYTYNDNKAGERKGLWNASTALLYSPNDRWTVGADIGMSRNPDPATSKALSYAVLGAQYHIGENIDLDFGISRTLHSGPKEHGVGVGFTMRW